jgi:hypothetical protein
MPTRIDSDFGLQVSALSFSPLQPPPQPKPNQHCRCHTETDQPEALLKGSLEHTRANESARNGLGELANNRAQEKIATADGEQAASQVDQQSRNRQLAG